MLKKELRKIIRQQINELSGQYIEDASREICRKVLDSEQYKKCRSIFIYVSMEREPSTWELIKKALTDGKKVYVPKCNTENKMKAIRISSTDELKPGMMGIYEPESDIGLGEIKNDKPEAASEKNSGAEQKIQIDLSIIPCISAGSDGSRLGHGAGYYDRFLNRTETYTMCLCFRKMLSDEIEMSVFDVPMDAVISE